MSHASRIVTCNSTSDAHAFHGITKLPRSGDLDMLCPECSGHGQWNVEIDLVSQRSKRACCVPCHGRGWIETTGDMLPSHDVEMSKDGHPKWVVRLDPPDRD